MRQPLTARQLVLILVVLGLVIWGAAGVRDVNKQADHPQQVITCLDNAPLGFDCERNPNAYGSGR